MSFSFERQKITIANDFRKLLDESNRKPNKIWMNKGSGFYNTWMKSWLQDNDIEMYSIHAEGKSVVAERSFRTLKNKIYKYMPLVLKDVYIDKIDELVNMYNNTYQSTIKIKPTDVKSSTYFDFSITRW